MASQLKLGPDPTAGAFQRSATTPNLEPAPELPPDVWGAVARAALAAEGHALAAWARLSLVSRAWRDGLTGESPDQCRRRHAAMALLSHRHKPLAALCMALEHGRVLLLQIFWVLGSASVRKFNPNSSASPGTLPNEVVTSASMVMSREPRCDPHNTAPDTSRVGSCLVCRRAGSQRGL